MTNRLAIRRPAVEPPALRPKQEAFAQAYVTHGNASRAYREAFECQGSSPATVSVRAYELVHAPAVAARIRELYAVAAEGALIDARSRMVGLQAITEADPGELVRTVAEPCRWCHGAGHRHQWINADEYVDACDDAVREGKAPPDCDGGFGYTPHAKPAEDCPRCFGYGVTRVVVTPTDQLSPSARKLLKGVRQKASGEIEVRMHDQLAAADMLNKMQGVYVDRSVSLNVTANVTPLADMSRDQLLDMLDSIKPG